MDERLRELSRVVEQGRGSPEQIREYIALKIRGGCSAGAHGALVQQGDSDELRCETCGELVFVLNKRR